MSTVIQVANLSKRYRLGLIGRTTLHEDLSRWWAKRCGRADPTLRLDQRRAAGALAGGVDGDDADHIWALRDVTFDVRQGEVLGLVGRNGAGKSTLLKILSRVTSPTSGVARLKGRVASLLEVGTGFNPELTGRDNIYLNGMILGMRRPDVRRRFDEIVAFADLAKFVDTPVKRYSSGMYVRLAFAIAAHLDPEILIVDEVLAVGDAEFQSKCMGKMEAESRGGRTILFVSHNMTAVDRLCSRALLVSGGRIAMDGSPAAVIDEYLSTAGAEGSGEVVGQDPDGHTVRLAIGLGEAGARRGLHAFAGDDLQFTADVTLDRELDNLELSIGVYDASETLLATFSTASERRPLVLPSGRSRLRCLVPASPFNVGRHYVNVCLSRAGTVLCSGVRCLSFDVVGDRLSTPGSVRAGKQPLVLLRHEWRF